MAVLEMMRHLIEVGHLRRGANMLRDISESGKPCLQGSVYFDQIEGHRMRRLWADVVDCGTAAKLIYPKFPDHMSIASDLLHVVPR